MKNFNRSFVTKFVAIFLAILFSATACTVSVKPNVPDDGILARVAVFSDVHIGLGGMKPDSSEKFASAIDQVNAYFGKTDAIIIAGDFTNTGEDYQYEEFNRILNEHKQENTKIAIQMGNHEYYRSSEHATGSYNHSLECQEAYLKHIGPLETDTLVNGIHFIGLSPRDGYGNYKKATTYLDKHVRAAAKQNPKAPIFVFTHEGFGDAYIPPESTFERASERLLNSHPQIISLSGHTHCPINDPRMIVQKNITTVQTATVGSYFGNHKGDTPLNPPGGDVASQGLLITIDKDYVVRIVRYDFANRSQIGQTWVIDTPAICESKETAFNYTLDKRMDAAANPVFPKDAKIDISSLKSDRVNIKFPVANVYDEVSDNVIYYYKIRVKNLKDGSISYSENLITDYFLGENRRPVYSINISDLTDNCEYEVSVIAESAWGKTSEPLTARFVTPKDDGSLENLPKKILSVNYSTGDYRDLISDAKCDIGGEPILKDGVAILNGNATYSYALTAENYAEITDTLCLEATVNIDKEQSFTAHEVALLSNTEAAGFGISYYDDGNVYATVNVGGSYFYASAPVECNKWQHIVLNYDGCYLRLFINGELCDSVLCNNSIRHVNEDSRRLVVGGDVTPNSSPSYLSNIKIKNFNLYNDFLTKNEIYNLYRANV